MLRLFSTLMLTLFFNSAIAITAEQLPLDIKVGQLIIGCIHGETLSKESEKLLKESKLGNVIYFNWSNELTSKKKTRALSKQIIKQITTHTKILPLIAIDQEGGRIERLKGEFSHFPGNGALGELNDPSFAYKTAALMGKEMSDVGINLNLAPVVDVNSNPNNPVINNRSFSDQPEKVITLGQKMIDGFHQGGVLTTLKHFPGHGDTSIDSHTGLPLITKSIKELERVELAPFKALHSSTDAIMTAHIVVSSLDSQPATLSKIILQDLLREKWGFKGVIISDSMVMRGISKNQSSFEKAAQCVSERTVEAFLAGCDMIIVSRLEWADFVPTPAQDSKLIARVITHLKEKVLDGTIPEECLNASVNRILAMKQSLDAQRPKQPFQKNS